MQSPSNWNNESDGEPRAKIPRFNCNKYPEDLLKCGNVDEERDLKKVEKEESSKVRENQDDDTIKRLLKKIDDDDDDVDK